MRNAVSYEKRSITLPTHIAQQVRESVGPGGFSAYVSEALQLKLERDALAEELVQMESRHGPADEKEVGRILDWLANGQ